MHRSLANINMIATRHYKYTDSIKGYPLMLKRAPFFLLYLLYSFIHDPGMALKTFNLQSSLCYTQIQTFFVILNILSLF